MALVKQKTTQNPGRLNVRMPVAIKERVAQAAYVSGQDLTEFAISALNDRAIEVLQKHDDFELTENERRAFFNILAAEIPEPTEKAVAAARRYLRGLKKGATYELAD